MLWVHISSASVRCFYWLHTFFFFFFFFFFLWRNKKMIVGYFSYLEFRCKAYFLILRFMLAWVMPHVYTLSRSVWSENIWTATSWNTQCLTLPRRNLAILCPVWARLCSHPVCLSRISVRLWLGGSDVKLCQVGHILTWRFNMKCFLWPFSAFRWFKKGRCEFLAKECAQRQVNCLEDEPCTRKSVVRKTDHPDKTLIWWTGLSNQPNQNPGEWCLYDILQTVNPEMSFTSNSLIKTFATCLQNWWI